MVEPVFMEQDEYEEYLAKQEQQKKQPIGSTTLYELNKTAVSSLKKMNNTEINNALEKVLEWYYSLQDNDILPQYFMLLNRDYNYYTLFVDTKTFLDSGKRFIQELKDLLTNWYADKDIRAIDVEKNSAAVEIWAMWDGNPTVAYLFPYDKGVIEY